MADNNGTPNDPPPTDPPATAGNPTFVTTPLTDDIIVSHFSGRVISRLWSILIAIATLISFVWAVAGYFAYQQFLGYIEDQTASRIAQLIDDSEPEIRRDITNIITTNTEMIVDSAIDAYLDSAVEENAIIERLESELASISSRLVQDFDNRTARIFPVLSDIERLTESRGTDILRIFDDLNAEIDSVRTMSRSLESAQIALATGLSGQIESLRDLADNDIPALERADQQASDALATLREQAAVFETEVRELEERVALFRDAALATGAMCDLFIQLSNEALFLIFVETPQRRGYDVGEINVETFDFIRDQCRNA